MHPDFSLVLQKCASNLSLKHKQPILYSAYINGKTMANTASEITNNSSEDTEDLVRIVSDEEDETEIEENYPPHHVQQEEDDNISLCSELSVGKENPGEEPSAASVGEDEEILDISDTHSNSSNEEMQHSPSVSSQETGINPFALAHNLRFPVPFGLQPNAATTAVNISPFQEEFLRKSHLYAEELMKHQMQLMAAARASAFSLRSNSLTQLHHTHQISPTANLVHHLNPLAKIGQLSAAAAAALSVAAQQNHNKPLNHTQHTHHMLQQQQQQQQQQHQHLHQQYDTLAKLTDLSKQHSPASTTSTQHMMSTLNQLQTQMQAHLPGLLHDNNDNLHERALKFSIDNILKADFGRSNSLDSPPHVRKSGQHKSHTQRQNRLNTTSSSSSSVACNSAHTMLTDSLEHSAQSLVHNISPSTQTFSTSLATICTNSNDSSSTAVSSSYSSANGAADLVKSSPSQTPTLSPGFSTSLENGAAGSGTNKNVNSSSKSEESTTTATSTSATGTGNGPIVWPAWVYCTRYSDRPSSGKFNGFGKCLPRL
ncbi:homeobox protein invected-like [Lucilia cuprina]|uniref:homeobox protein invected-like n=1 Tax=Lucilia cuprina TaxID=7375 RepID=UPI001F0611CD|nr:homeobox protein invected-like [Lucilia cuprina]